MTALFYRIKPIQITKSRFFLKSLTSIIYIWHWSTDFILLFFFFTNNLYFIFIFFIYCIIIISLCGGRGLCCLFVCLFVFLVVINVNFINCHCEFLRVLSKGTSIWLSCILCWWLSNTKSQRLILIGHSMTLLTATEGVNWAVNAPQLHTCQWPFYQYLGFWGGGGAAPPPVAWSCHLLFVTESLKQKFRKINLA